VRNVRKAAAAVAAAAGGEEGEEEEHQQQQRSALHVVFIKRNQLPASWCWLVLLSAFSAWLVLITSCQQRVAILVRSRAGQAEAEAAASSQQLAATNY
jgi:hypothetical protein